MTASPRTLNRQQYALLFRSMREALPLRRVAGEPSFVRTFPDRELPLWLRATLDCSLAAKEDVAGLLLRLHSPWIGTVVSRFAERAAFELHGPDLEQEAKLKFLEVVGQLAEEGAELPRDVPAYLRAAVLNLLRNKWVRAGRERRRVTESVEAFEERLEARHDAEGDEELSGLDVLVMGHRELNEDVYMDAAEAIETREFWAEVDRVVGLEDRVALVAAHVLRRPQREVAAGLGRSYKSARDHLSRLRSELRRDERFARRYGRLGLAQGEERTRKEGRKAARRGG